MSFMASVAVCAPRRRDFCVLSWNRATGEFRASTREIKRKAPTHSQECRGCFCVFGAPYGRRKTHEQPRQNRDKSTTKNTALRLSQRDKTGTKVRQKTRLCRCLSVAKPWQKWGKNPRLRAVTVCQNRVKSVPKNPRLRVVTRRFPRQSISAGKRPFPDHRCKTSAGA